MPTEDGRERASDRSACVRVVGDTKEHEQGAEVGETQTQGAIVVGVLGDAPGRVGREIDEDLLGHEENSNGMPVPVDIEGTVLAQELRKVQARKLHAESSRNMYSEHGFEALIRRCSGTCASG